MATYRIKLYSASGKPLGYVPYAHASNPTDYEHSAAWHNKAAVFRIRDYYRNNTLYQPIIETEE